MNTWGQSTRSGNSHWLDRERLTIYPRLVVALFVIMGTAWILLSENMLDLKGKPLGYDFITFWGASYLGLTGHAAEAYDIQLLLQAEQIAVPASTRAYAWFYPPPFFLVVLPLSLLPYTVAFWTFMGTTLAGYLLVLRRVVREPVGMWCAAAFPAVWVNLFHGQNGFLTASLAGAAILALKRHPASAGVLVGLLAIKPHLALLFPIALVAIGAWRTILCAALTVAALTAIGIAVLGIRVVEAWLGSLQIARLFIETGVLPLAKMPSLYAALRLIDAPLAFAYCMQALLAIAAATVVWRVWRRNQDWGLRGATLMAGSLLVSPYLFDYDLVWLALPIAWLAVTGVRNGWLRGEREVLVCTWVMPLLATPISAATGLQVAPVVICALLWIAARRAGVNTILRQAPPVNPV